MIKNLNYGDTIAVISLSSGILGENYSKIQLEMGIKNLKKLSLNVVFTPNALKGVDYLSQHPKAKAYDLKWAFSNPDIKGILCSIGGDDAYKTIPYLLEDNDFINIVKKNPKIFIGFSDATMLHLMFYKLGLPTIYGPNFMSDLAEISGEIFPYTEKYLNFLFNNKDIEVVSSDVWYENRKNHSLDDLQKDRVSHVETDGIVILGSKNEYKGHLFGGCIESICSLLENGEANKLLHNYDLLSLENLNECILFLESAESFEKIKHKLLTLKKHNFFDKPSAIIFGKMIDGHLYEFIDMVVNIVDNKDIALVFNMNFGHLNPRCILPYGSLLTINSSDKKILIKNMFNN